MVKASYSMRKHTQLHSKVYGALYNNMYGVPCLLTNRGMSMEKYMYKIENLNKDFTDGDGVCHALKSINLSISTGQMVAIVGKSGSGKSTLFNILGAIDHATDGRVIINGKNIAELSEGELCKYRSETVGFVFQAFHIIESYTVYDNTELPLIINKVPKSQRDEMIKRTVERVGLSDKLRTKCSKLSGGEKQRAAIARAFVHSPKVILADEPCGNLDSHNSESVMKLLRSFVNEDTLVMMVTHSKTDAELCDRIITLSDGTVISDEVLR